MTDMFKTIRMEYYRGFNFPNGSYVVVKKFSETDHWTGEASLMDITNQEMWSFSRTDSGPIVALSRKQLLGEIRLAIAKKRNTKIAAVSDKITSRVSDRWPFEGMMGGPQHIGRFLPGGLVSLGRNQTPSKKAWCADSLKDLMKVIRGK